MASCAEDNILQVWQVAYEQAGMEEEKNELDNMWYSANFYYLIKEKFKLK